MAMNDKMDVGSDTNPLARKSLGHVLVTGGCGFLGGTILSLLLSRKVCSKLSVIDLRPSPEPKDGVDYHFGDITDESVMHELFTNMKPDVVIHTASPHFNVPSKTIMHKVNVEGTRTILKVSQDTGVKALVYTSSASVISDTLNDLVNADETYPLVMGAQQPEYYTTTKAMAEQQVLAANRTSAHPSFLTCAIRPSGIFGIGDAQLLPQGLTAYYRGQTKFQIGDNENLFDFTEVVNVAHAHHLAAAALLATHERSASGGSAPLDTERVDGEAFLVTNDTPIYFYDFARMAWKTAGDKTLPADVWVLPKGFGLFIATMFEWIFWLFRLGKPNLTRQQVRYSCMTRYYCIDKAKTRLGYKPIIGLKEGVQRAVRDIIRRGAVPNMPKHLIGVVPDDGETKKSR